MRVCGRSDTRLALRASRRELPRSLKQETLFLTVSSLTRFAPIPCLQLLVLMPCARPPRRCPRARARNAQPNPNGDADVALLQSRFFAPPATRPEPEPPAARATSSGSCTHAPAEPLEDAARAELYKIASGEEHGALRAEHERLMDAEPGYCAFFVEWLDRRQRLLDAKPVLIQGA